MQKLLTENCGGRKSSWWDARWAAVNDINNFVYMYNMSPPVNVNNHCFWIFLDRLVCHGPPIAALDPEFCPIGWPAKDSTWVKKVVRKAGTTRQLTPRKQLNVFWTHVWYNRGGIFSAQKSRRNVFSGEEARCWRSGPSTSPEESPCADCKGILAEGDRTSDAETWCWSTKVVATFSWSRWWSMVFLQKFGSQVLGRLPWSRIFRVHFQSIFQLDWVYKVVFPRWRDYWTFKKA